jgi:hypothetical protein
MKRAAFDEDFPRGGGDAYGAAEPSTRGGQSRAGGAAARPTKRRAVALPRVEDDQVRGAGHRAVSEWVPRAALADFPFLPRAQDDAAPGLTSRVGTFVEQLKYKVRRLSRGQSNAASVCRGVFMSRAAAVAVAGGQSRPGSDATASGSRV